MKKLAAFCTVFFSCAMGLDGDTITLKNGAKIDGKIDEAQSTPQEAVLVLGEKAKMKIARWQIQSIEKNALTGVRPAPAEAPEAPPPESGNGAPLPVMVKDLVLIRSRKTASGGEAFSQYGKVNGLSGQAPGDLHLEIVLPDNRTERLSWRQAGASAAPSAATGPEVHRTPTSHVVQLKNGRRIPGNPAAASEKDPLILKLGPLGRLLIQRADIEKLEPAAGELSLPADLAGEAAEAGPASPSVAEAQPGAAHPDQASAQPAASVPAADQAPAIDPELEDEILAQIDELTRNRTRNRTRAESHLKELGAPALPYLASIAGHPFELTRRAVQRIVRDLGEWGGMAIAIDGLLDEDEYVRVHASEALRQITHIDLGYQPYASPRSRLEAQKRWKEFYQEKNHP